MVEDDESLVVRRPGLVSLPEEVGVGQVHHHPELGAGDAVALQPVAPVGGDGDDPIGQGTGDALLPPDQGHHRVGHSPPGAGREELGEQIVDVEDHLRPQQPGHRRRQHQGVGRIVDLDDVEPVPEMGCRQPRPRQEEEMGVLEALTGQAGTPVAAYGQPADGDPVHHLACRLARVTQAHHGDVEPLRRQRRRLPLDPGLTHRVVGVDDHAQTGPHQQIPR